MDWLINLFTTQDTVGHIVLLYGIVIACGVLLGKIKFGGISLGVTFVLFCGIVAGHFHFTAPTPILNFMQDFGLILFVFIMLINLFLERVVKGGEWNEREEKKKKGQLPLCSDLSVCGFGGRTSGSDSALCIYQRDRQHKHWFFDPGKKYTEGNEWNCRKYFEHHLYYFSYKIPE